MLQNPSKYIYNLQSNSSAIFFFLSRQQIVSTSWLAFRTLLPLAEWSDPLSHHSYRISTSLFLESLSHSPLLHLGDICSGHQLDVGNVGIAYETSWRIGYYSTGLRGGRKRFVVLVSWKSYRQKVFLECWKCAMLLLNFESCLLSFDWPFLTGEDKTWT